MAQQRAIRKNSIEAEGKNKSRTRQASRSTSSLPGDQLLHLQQTLSNEMVGRLIHAQTGAMIQRQPNDQRSAPGEERSIASTISESKNSGRRLIVDDGAVELAPGQTRKSEFLAQLRSEVCRTANEAMAATGQSTEGCPYLESWLEYSEKDSEHIERAWTHDFVKYFHQLGRTTPQGIYLGASWTPLLDYYQRASDEARQNAITQLTNYYNNPPGAGGNQENVRELFRLWLARRDQSSLLIQRLNDRLPAGAPQR